MIPEHARWIFVGGMIRSGSTLQFQIVKHLVEGDLGGSSLGFQEASEIDARLAAAESDQGTRFPCVVKSHVCTAGIRERLEQGSAAAFYTYRDIRDIVVSGSRNFRIPVDEFISGRLLDQAIGESYLWTSNPAVSSAAFEFLMGDMAAWIRGMMECLGIAPDEPRVAELVAAYSIDRQRERMKAASHTDMQGFSVDPETLLHRDHIDRAAVGGWREVLDADQVARIETIAGDWMSDHGYAFVSPESSRTAVERARGIRARTARHFQECDRILLERENLLKHLSAEAADLASRLGAAEHALRLERQTPQSISRWTGLHWRRACRKLRRLLGRES
jgi:hypothetical protein